MPTTLARPKGRPVARSAKRAAPRPAPPAPDLERMRASALQACRLMKVMSNPDRLLLLCQLAQGEKCVSELESLVGVLQPTLSQQLGVLRDEALVSTRREGKHIHYRVDSPQALALMQVLYDQFCNPIPEDSLC